MEPFLAEIKIFSVTRAPVRTFNASTLASSIEKKDADTQAAVISKIG